MWTYIAADLPALIAVNFPADMDRQSILGTRWAVTAFTIALRNPGRSRAVSAFALIEDSARLPPLLVDRGATDSLLETELRPELLRAACDAAGIDLTLNLREG